MEEPPPLADGTLAKFVGYVLETDAGPLRVLNVHPFSPRHALFEDEQTNDNIRHREEQIAAVYNNENPQMLGMSSMMGQYAISSLVDNIILMNWIELGDTFRLGLTVAKMRANPCGRATHECEIVNGHGMRVLPRELKLPATIPFSAYSGLISRAPERHEREESQ